MAHAAGITDRLTQGFSDGLSGFRQQDKYFKAQAAILSGWLAISVATVLILTLTGQSQNKLGAEVKAESAVGGTMLFVTNTSPTAWSDVTYTLNGVYIWREAVLAAGDHVAIPLKRFRKGGAGGKHMPRDTPAQTLSVRCEQGQFQTALSVVGAGT